MPSQTEEFQVRKKATKAYKYVLSLLLILALVTAGLGMPVEAKSSPYKDVPPSHWAYSTIMWSKENNISSGYSDGSFQPSKLVTESEFVSMLLRCYPELTSTSNMASKPWHKAYYDLAKDLNWPVYNDPDYIMERGHAAELIAAALGQTAIYEEEAIQFLMDKGVAKGKPGTGKDGFGAADPLTRAEAQTFLYNLKQVQPKMSNPAFKVTEISLSGIKIGDSEQKVIEGLGKPDRIDPTTVQTVHYIYNQDYSHYVQIELHKGKVISMYSGGEDWNIDGVQGLSAIVSQAESRWGKATSYYLGKKYTLRGHVLEMLVDYNDNERVIGMRVLGMTTGINDFDMYKPPTAEVLAGYERQIFEFTNEFRTLHGLHTLSWNEAAAKAARLHSKDMAARNYFDHMNLEGESPGQRMAASGTGESYMWGENIAAFQGQADAMTVFMNWVTSTGHRENMLRPSHTTLGVGVTEGTSTSQYSLYNTQNFFTPE